MKPAELTAAMAKVSSEVMPWEDDILTPVRKLQDALRNQGCVELMQSLKEGGSYVAVKRMPNKWVRTTPKEFNKQYPESAEKPWVDLGLLKHLNALGCPYVCELLGVFRDGQETYVVTSFCTEGDLFAWCSRESVPEPGPEREKQMLPIVVQVLTAVRWLHECGIAHRDISLENILLTESPGGTANVKVIDFGMAALARTCKGLCGKQFYQSPEMHLDAPHSSFLADVFAVGIVLFAMAAQDYPWKSTRLKSCHLFEYATTFGLRRFLQHRKLRRGEGEFLIDVFTPAFSELLEALLQVRPEQRATLAESCFMAPAVDKPRKNVWEMDWLESVQFAAGVVDDKGASKPACFSFSFSLRLTRHLL